MNLTRNVFYITDILINLNVLFNLTNETNPISIKSFTSDTQILIKAYSIFQLNKKRKIIKSFKNNDCYFRISLQRVMECLQRGFCSNNGRHYTGCRH